MKIGAKHSELARSKIRTGLLLKRLEDHALGEIELKPEQVQSIRILLGKAMPDMKSMEMIVDGQVATKAITKTEAKKINSALEDEC
ncbi:hypothetical protein OAF54_01650 [bacterium]|nr:hypothetical protein [bacterium]